MLGTALISDRLTAILDDVRVLDDGLAVDLRGEEYVEDTPAALAKTLGSLLYQVFHNGRERPAQLAMRSFRDPVQEQRLEAVTPRTRRLTEVSVVADGIVEIDRVRVRLPAGVQAVAVGETMELGIPSARPGLSPGFYYLFGPGDPHLHGPLLRVYLHVTDASTALEMWPAVLAGLADAPGGWHAKVVSNRLLYPRFDGLVVYLPRRSWSYAPVLASAASDTGLLGTGQSPFTRSLGAGVGCAFEPTDTREIHRGTSFGQHRSNILAQALVAHALEPAEQTLEESIYTAFVDADIDPLEPARNLSSPATSFLGLD